ncbi:hypothetical protein Nepgr_006284 [Nepenthes gracilis]|uniref:Beta-glucosidase n=1 Tax=Nepenthes gracilis TaxID=150966 RepID=A0AAD3S590_NEPGR|nr:hypothetical protein Nepgr_006284 [Nepenthes gracilis]
MKGSLFLCLLAMACLSACTADDDSSFNRSSFPAGFLFGAGSSAYQYEGAAFEDGKGKNIWDHFVELFPDKVSDSSNGTVAVDFYHKYKDDVKLMKEMGLDSFRFSISWSRVLPYGSLRGGINTLGVEFYNNLIDELIANGIKPFVTLFHWDLPQALMDEYCGFLSPLIVNDFVDFANLCFKLFGDRVKYWVTLNAPNIATKYGYDDGKYAPGRCSPYAGNCTIGNSAYEPYVVAHHSLLCHAATVNLYRKEYQHSQNGVIGISVATDWNLPLDHKPANRRAASRSNDFVFGWILDPIVLGHYPKSMQDIVGHRLPKFTDEQVKLLKGSFDFLGLNYYTAYFASDADGCGPINQSYTCDMHANLSSLNSHGEPIGEPTCLSWLYVYPEGIQDLLSYVKEKYNNPPIIITENGMADANNKSSIEEACKDFQRIYYHKCHLSYLHKSIENGANVTGYYAWSFLDDFEWASGYTCRSGFHYVDFDTQKRYPKHSASWFRTSLNAHNQNESSDSMMIRINDEL